MELEAYKGVWCQGDGACGVLSEDFLFCNGLNRVISFSGTNYNLFAYN